MVVSSPLANIKCNNIDQRFYFDHVSFGKLCVYWLSMLLANIVILPSRNFLASTRSLSTVFLSILGCLPFCLFPYPEWSALSFMTKFGHWFHDFLISCVVSLSHSLLFISFTRASFSALLVISRDGYLEGSFLSLFHRPLGPGVSTWFCWTSFSMQSAFSLTYISVLFFPGEKNKDFAWLQSYGDFPVVFSAVDF